ncbi:MAG: hypothetical protein JWR35_486 [Marmoricola sp.]|nr:hypothetical protein [Marmoricola sp.]
MPDQPAVTRRTVVSGAVITVLATGLTSGLATGCDVRNPLSKSGDGVPEPAAVSPDVTVAIQAVGVIRAAQLAATTTSQRHPALRPRLTALLDMHKAHLDALADAVPDASRATPTATPFVVPADPKVALHTIAVLETGGRSTIIGLALRAQSGAFARLLAGITAATSQRLVGLPKP